jgi:hypothetical protein
MYPDIVRAYIILRLIKGSAKLRYMRSNQRQRIPRPIKPFKKLPSQRIAGLEQIHSAHIFMVHHQIIHAAIPRFK